MKNIFFLKKNNFFSFSKIIFFIISLLIIIYFFSYIYFLNKDYFIISEFKSSYFIIPENKEGEIIKFIDKKSLNNISNSKSNIKLDNDTELIFSIQVHSTNDYLNLKKYYNNLLKIKKEIININDFYIISINSSLGTNYFLTYKNFPNKELAYSACKNISFIERCLILNLQK